MHRVIRGAKGILRRSGGRRGFTMDAMGTMRPMAGMVRLGQRGHGQGQGKQQAAGRASVMVGVSSLTRFGAMCGTFRQQECKSRRP